MDYTKSNALLVLLLFTTIPGIPAPKASSFANDPNTIDDVVVVPSDSNIVKKLLTKASGGKDRADTSKTGGEYTANSLKSKHIRITLGTTMLNGIHIKVVDAEGAPVKGAAVKTERTAGIAIAPGWLNGELLATMETDDNGEFAGALIAEYAPMEIKVTDGGNNSASDIVTFGAAGIKPTVDEFDKRISATKPYPVSLNVAGKTLTYHIEVDMGPTLVSSHNGTNVFNAPLWIGKLMEEPVEMELWYYQRTDECIYVSENADDDLGVWTDEDYSLASIRRIVVSDFPHTVYADRYDQRSHSIKLISEAVRGDMSKYISSAQYNGYITGPELPGDNQVTNNKSSPMRYYVVMDRAKGAAKVTFRVVDIQATYDSNLCKKNNSVYQLSARSPIIKEFSGEFTNIIPLRSYSPRIQVVLKDDMPPDPDPDPLPHVRSYSGLNLENLVIRLNNKEIFGETIKSIESGKYPYYCEVRLDNAHVEKLDEATLKEFSPGVFEFVYYPTLDQLNVAKPNRVEYSGVKDRVGNKASDDVYNFTMP